MATMQARYSGKCSRTGRPIVPGDTIDHDRRTKRATLISAQETEPGAEIGPDDDNESAGFIAPDAGRYISHTFRTSGGTFYRNKRGRCEDAPCCGCCTI